MFRLLVGVAIGFVIGSAAGRKSYEKIKTVATDVVSRPAVQSGLRKADDFVADKAPLLHDVAATAADATTDAKAPEATA